MKREDKYLLGCLFAIHQLQEKGSTEYAVRVGDEWETIPWKEICDWIEKQYAIESYAIESDE
jgi:hypothetical protein